MSNKSVIYLLCAITAIAIMQLATLVVVGETSKRVERIEQVVAPQETAAAVDTLAYLHQLELNRENFYHACAVYNVQHPEIVYAQAQLESGHFTSQVYRDRQNCLGLFDSRSQQYYSFAHWSDCIKAYKNSVQYKYDGVGDYYAFLTNLPYAEDSQYIRKVRWLVNRNANS